MRLDWVHKSLNRTYTHVHLHTQTHMFSLLCLLDALARIHSFLSLSLSRYTTATIDNGLCCDVKKKTKKKNIEEM